MTSKRKKLFPLLQGQAADQSALVAIPEGCDLQVLLRDANALSIAIAFGHYSGWELIEESVLSTNKDSIRILLGQAYFQTEPELLLHLQKEMETKPFLKVRLASSVRTFHPKVWIINRKDAREAIVGSGNLSKGGLANNVECNFYTKDTDARLQIDIWFNTHWELAADLNSSIESYIKAHKLTAQWRHQYHQRIADSEKALVAEQAEKEMSFAIRMATSYWTSSEGLEAIKQRINALTNIRQLLHYPDFKFTKEEWIEFLRVPEFGWIRPSHIAKTTAALPKLQAALTAVLTRGAEAIGELESIPGVGKNIASKLMVVCNSNDYVVINAPVIRALKRFGIDMTYVVRLDTQIYARFMEDIKPFVKALPNNLPAAPALDSFFIKYCGLAD